MAESFSKGSRYLFLWFRSFLKQKKINRNNRKWSGEEDRAEDAQNRRVIASHSSLVLIGSWLTPSLVKVTDVLLLCRNELNDNDVLITKGFRNVL